MVASPPRKSHRESFVRQTRGPALGTAPARGPWGFRHHRTSRRQTPTSAHARFRAGNGKEWGRTQHARNPATLPLKSPQPHPVHPASVRGPWSCHRLKNPTGKALFARPGAQPSAWHPHAAHEGSFITGPRGLLPSHSGGAGRGAHVCPCARGRGRAHWPAWPGPRPGSRPLTCALAVGPTPVPGAGSRTCTLAGVPRPVPRVPARPHLSARPRTHLAATAPHFSPVCAPLLAEFFNFLTDISV